VTCKKHEKENHSMPVLGLDLDDTSFEYLNGLKEFIIKEDSEFFAGMTEEEIQTHFPTLVSYDYFPWTRIKGDRKKFEEYHCNAVENGLFRSLKPHAGVSEALWKLNNEHDFHIYVITSRFVRHGQHARVLTDTAISLDEANIPYRDIMFVRDKVNVVADVYIDDSPKNIHNLREVGRNVIVYDQPYNQDFDGPRAHNWTEGYDILSTMF
jgi:5'(3')-deoxyribonucleotidase